MNPSSFFPTLLQSHTSSLCADFSSLVIFTAGQRVPRGRTGLPFSLYISLSLSLSLSSLSLSPPTFNLLRASSLAVVPRFSCARAETRHHTSTHSIVLALTLINVSKLHWLHTIHTSPCAGRGSGGSLHTNTTQSNIQSATQSNTPTQHSLISSLQCNLTHQHNTV
jgi:hypothetical protein